jgi:leishmanolysin-like peptidase
MIDGVHELGHILAFAAYLYKFFRHADGTPRTPRPFVEQPVACVDGSQIIGRAASNDTVQLVEALDGRLSYIIVTPRVRQVARNQLNCQEAVGARLEDQAGCVGSHWHERLFFGEVMSPALSVSSENVLSPLTLALMEDSGWYEVDYTGASIPSFGLGAGCDFVTGECIVDDQVPEWGKGYFCNSPIRFLDGEIEVNSTNNIMCDPSHRAWTLCDLWDEATVPRDLVAIPESSKRYFSDNELVPSFTLAEYCPIPTKSLGLDCTKDDEYTPFFVGESVGANSRCINAIKNNGQPVHRPPKVTCDAVEGKVIIGMVKTSKFALMTASLPIPSSTSDFLECPRLATICPELFSCIDSCAGRAVCVYDGPVPVCVDAADLLLASAEGVGPSSEFVEDTPEDSVDTSAAINISLCGLWVTILVLLTHSV